MCMKGLSKFPGEASLENTSSLDCIGGNRRIQFEYGFNIAIECAMNLNLIQSLVQQAARSLVQQAVQSFVQQAVLSLEFIPMQNPIQ